MPHTRHRFLTSQIQKDMKWAPVVSLLGMRQVGKTTLARSVANDYLTLDDDAVLIRFPSHEWADLEGRKGSLCIDEAQKAPGLFDRVKLIVDRTRKPGRFLLTGSVRFLSMKQIRESLTGRTSILELLPLTLAESHGLPPSRFFEAILKSHKQGIFKTTSQFKSRFSSEQVAHYLEVGGLPGICFKRNTEIRKQIFGLHLDTLLSRDLRIFYPTSLELTQLRTLAAELARLQGDPLNHTALARKVGVSAPTVRRLLSALQALFLIRPCGGTFYFEDQGIASFLLPSVQNPKHLSLFDRRRVLFQELFSQLNYQYRGIFTLSHYQTRGGIDVPFLMQFHDGTEIAIVIDETQSASDRSQKSLTWLKKIKKNLIGIIVNAGSDVFVTRHGHLVVPIERFF